MANATAIDDNLESTALAYYMLSRYLHLATYDTLHDQKTAILQYLTSPQAAYIWVLVGLIVLLTPYLCFQKHMLPHWAGKLVGRCYFYPCLPCTIIGNRIEFKGRWWAHVADDGGAPVLLGQAPLFTSQLRELERLGVGAVVNLCDEYSGRRGFYSRRGWGMLWLKTVDHLEPPTEAMRTACSFIEHQRARGVGVYIHCKSGRGRSAAIAMAWLMGHRDMTPREAQDHLLAARKVRSKLWRQKNVVRFYRDLLAARAGEAATPAALGTFAVGKPAKPPPQKRMSIAQQLLHPKQLGASVMAPLTDYAVESAPPDWDNGTVFEINVAPMSAALAPEHMGRSGGALAPMMGGSAMAPLDPIGAPPVSSAPPPGAPMPPGSAFGGGAAAAVPLPPLSSTPPPPLGTTAPPPLLGAAPALGAGAAPAAVAISMPPPPVLGAAPPVLGAPRPAPRSGVTDEAAGTGELVTHSI